MGSGSSSNVAFILSLIGGILILIGGLASSMWFMLGGSNFWGMMNGYGGMMGGLGWMMGGYGFPFGFMAGFSLVALVSGILVIFGALMLESRPAERMTWGVVIMVFSIISFVGMGGFVLGALLGISGGVFAMSVRYARP
jgi:hypothetical protein